MPITLRPLHLKTQPLVPLQANRGAAVRTRWDELQEIGPKCAVLQMQRGRATCDRQVLLTLGKSGVK